MSPAQAHFPSIPRRYWPLLILVGVVMTAWAAWVPAQPAASAQGQTPPWAAAQSGPKLPGRPPEGLGTFSQDGPPSFLDEDIEMMALPEQPDAEEKPVLWPFNPDDYARVLGMTAEKPSDKARDALAFWTWAVQEFTAQRRSLAGLNEQQAFLLDQLEQVRGYLTEESLSLPEIERRAQIRELFMKAQENEEKIEQVQNAMKEVCGQAAPRAAEIRKRLVGVREALERKAPSVGTVSVGKDAARKPQGQPGAGDRLDPLRSFQYRQQLDDAIGLLEQVEKAPADAVGLLMANMRKFRAYRSRQGGVPVLLTRFEEQIARLEQSQKVLQWRLTANDREIKGLRDLLGKTLEKTLELGKAVELGKSLDRMQELSQPATLEKAGAPTAPPSPTPSKEAAP